MSGELAKRAERLRRWNRWRRGAGEYKYEGRPEGYRPIPSPEDPKELGNLIEDAAFLLDALDRWAETGNAAEIRKAVLKIREER